jgi:hypothetical protein
MSTRADVYANQFDDLSRQFIADVESYTPDQMQAVCAGEQCTVAALASHVAEGHTAIAGWVATAAAGDPFPPITMDDIDAMNAEQFARDANRPKQEILAALRENGAAASNLVRGLDDSELDRSVYVALVGSDVTAEWLIQNILIDELVQHPASVRAACEKATTA